MALIRLTDEDAATLLDLAMNVEDRSDAEQSILLRVASNLVDVQHAGGKPFMFENRDWPDEVRHTRAYNDGEHIPLEER